VEQQDSIEVVPVSSDSQVEGDSVTTGQSLDWPIALRKGTRATAGRPETVWL